MHELQNYSCSWREFAERHYAKVFSKKYKGAWLTTRDDLISVCMRIDRMLELSRADLIASVDQYKLVKLDFAVAGTRVSPKASGNRCILLVNEDTRHVDILLAYSKNDIGPPNETQKWKALVNGRYGDVSTIFRLS
jgi:hypothetical protein